jgi:TFIIF-interacting CTD phosphatase-like protein
LVDDDDDGEFSDDVDLEDGEDKGPRDPSQLIDLELVNLLKFCNNLKEKHKESEEHQDNVMMQSTELGGSKKQKTLILDMDETMIAAKFSDKLPKNFIETFSFPFSGSNIHVRLRPYLSDTLDKLKEMYELVAWTAGVQDYADPILDRIDPDNTIFKKRLYRDSCIKCE